MVDAIRKFFELESAGGIVLMAAAALAIMAANSPLASLYDALLTLPFTIALGEAAISKPLLLWINDGLMAIFFLLVALELKRAILAGPLAGEQVLLPIMAAIGGMAVPALIYAVINVGDAAALRGWAIPAATDIAFALGVMALLGNRVPLSLKILLTTIAVIDDLGAIIVIAIFYTSDLSLASLALAGAAIVALAFLNQRGVTRLAPYLIVGVLLWAFVLKSGVHATLAGVVVGLAIPLRAADARGESPLRHLEHMLHPWVAYGILPVFAFANAGLPLLGLALDQFVGTVPLGIILGLVAGKPIGVLAGAAVALALFRVRLPAETTPKMLIGMAVLTGIGFTMSLFIGSLAFDSVAQSNAVRLGVLFGSLVSALIGSLVLLAASAKTPPQATRG